MQYYQTSYFSAFLYMLYKDIILSDNFRLSLPVTLLRLQNGSLKIKIEWKETNYAILSKLILLYIFIYAIQRHYFIRQLSLVTSRYFTQTSAW